MPVQTHWKRLTALIVAAASLTSLGLATVAGPNLIRNSTTTGLTAAADYEGQTLITASRDAGQYPEELQNGSFDYPGRLPDIPTGQPEEYYNWTSVSPDTGEWIVNGGNGTGSQWGTLDGFDAKKFAWTSSQEQGAEAEQKAHAVEIQKDRSGNWYSELCAYQAGTAIRQVIHTQPGVMYKVSLRHASMDDTYLDRMQVLIGDTDGEQKPVEMTRQTTNGNGDKIGEKSTTVATRVSNTDRRDHDSQWETYTGTYIATSDKTTFTFKSVDAKVLNQGNLLDDIVFTRAYKLDYDANGGTGEIPSDQTPGTTKPASTSTMGGVRLAADDASQYPTALVNGDFSYPKWNSLNLGSTSQDWTAISPDDATSYGTDGYGVDSWRSIPDFQADRFGWRSNQTTGENANKANPNERKAGAVEIQKDVTGNRYSEITAAQAGTYNYQIIHTQPGTLYKVRLKHASLNDSEVQKMQVLVGSVDDPQPVEMTRTSVNGHGDQLGEKSTTIATRTTNTDNRDHKGQWETYEGTYVATSDTTIFTFKSVWSSDPNFGNLIDDVVFDLAYKLTYDGNGGTGQVPSDEKSESTKPASTDGTDARVSTGELRVLTTTEQDGQKVETRSDGSVRVQTIADDGSYSGCQVYYPAGATINLATAAQDSDCWDSSKLSKTDGNGNKESFLGWSEGQHGDVSTKAEQDAAGVTPTTTMLEGGRTVWAVWATGHTVTYNTNLPADAQLKDGVSTPVSITVPYGQGTDDTSGWTWGDLDKRTGYKFEGWWDSPDCQTDQCGTWHYWGPDHVVEDNITVYAKWTPIHYTVHFDPGMDGTSGETPDQAFTWDQAQDLTGNGFSKKGWTFTGWVRQDNQASYKDRQNVLNLTDQDGATITMVAQWRKDTVHVNYDANGGSGSHDPTEGDAYGRITIPGDVNDPFHRPGWSLTGWNTQPDGSGQSYGPNDQIPVEDKDVTLYAQWKMNMTVMPFTGGQGWSIPGTLLWLFLIGLVSSAVAWPILRKRKSTGSTSTGRHTA